jgi:hypothetical protein
MEVTHTETNRGQPAIVVDGILYRIRNTLKSGDVVYRCTAKSCKMSITTDKDGTRVLKAKNQHTCESSQSDRKTEALRIRSRNKSGDITKRPSHIIRTALQTMDEQTLQSADIKNVAKAVYRERRKKLPTLPKNRKDVHDVVDEVNTKTNKDESLLLINDRDAEIIIFSAYLNMECLCNSMSAL